MVWTMSWNGWKFKENKAGTWRRQSSVSYCKLIFYYQTLQTLSISIYILLVQIRYNRMPEKISK